MDRNEIEKKYKWNLEEIYSSTKEYDRDLKKLKEINEKLEAFKGKVLKDSKTLLNLLNTDLEKSLLVDKLYIYVSLHSALDTRDTSWSSMMQSLFILWSELESKTSFIPVELAKLTDSQLDKFIKEEPKIKKYEFALRKTIRKQKHVLSEKEEILLAKISPVLDGGDSIFEKLDNADISLGDIEDSEGNKIKLTQGKYRNLVTSSDKVVRKNACYKMHEYYEKHKNSIGECLSNHINTDVILSKIRGYDNSLKSYLDSDNIDTSFYKNFIETVHIKLPTLHRMMDLYKKALKLEEMHIYDINARVGEFSRKFDIEEIKNIISESLSIMGGDYLKVVDKAWSENWVDFYETEGKRSGAFSSGSYQTKPYILLNYTGGFDDVETLAHELGHSIHSYYSDKNRGPEDAQYPIFLAEIASTTHEVLLNNYLLKNTVDIEEKKYILNNILSNFKSTVFRQTEFAEFEMIAHEKFENGEVLSYKEFTDIYFDLQKKYYGPNVIIDDIIKYEILRIPHFYTSFYVYKYAIGLVCAYKFAGDIINKKPGAVENYIKFISSGGKNYPCDILKECGIDLSDFNMLDEAIKLIEKYLDEFEKLI